MTAAELIAALQEYPPDLPVYISAEAGQVWVEVEGLFKSTAAFYGPNAERAVVGIDAGV